MVSRMMLGEKPLRLTVGSGGIRWSRKADKRNRCIGRELRGTKPGSVGKAQDNFEDAVDKCT